MLLPEGSTGNGDHPHVNGGRKHMSNADTRLSVIGGVCRHDPERWREFDAIYRPILVAYVRARGLNRVDCHDVVQDILVKLLAKIHTYDKAKCRFRAWLFTVAQNTLTDRARRAAAYKKALEGWAVRVLRATPSDSAKMEAEWTRIHRVRILEHALRVVRARVSSRAWSCFEQRLLRNRPAAEIAADLGLEPGTVFVNASRVLKRVRAVCQEFDEDLSDVYDSSVSRRD
jgi:RNA polymerase sigma-70 factor (ECF subfamily)